MAEALAHYTTAMLIEAEQGRESLAALQHYARAADLMPGQHRLYAKVAASALVQKLPDLAITALEQSLGQSPDTFSACIDLATAHQLLGHRKEAIHYFQRALRLDVTNPAVYRELGRLLFDDGRDREALALFDRGMRSESIGPQIRALLYSYGLRFVQEEQVARGIPCFERLAPFANERSSRIWSIIGQLHETVQQTGPAEEAYRKALKDADAPADTYLRLAVLTAAHNPTAAADILQQAETAFATNSSPLPLGPTTITATIRLALTAPLQVSPLIEAVNHRLDREHQIPVSETLSQIAALIAEAELEMAIAFIEAIRPQRPDDALLTLVLGELYSRKGRHAEALTCFDRLRLDSTLTTNYFTETFYLLHGAAAERTGNFDKAVAIFEQGLAAHPKAHEIQNYLAYMWAEKGLHLDEALVLVNGALQHMPDNAAYLDTRGWIYYRQGQYAQALRDLQAAAGLMQEDPTITDHLGDTLMALGRSTAAIDQWKASYRLDATENVLKKLMAQGVTAEALAAEAAASTNSAPIPAPAANGPDLSEK